MPIDAETFEEGEENVRGGEELYSIENEIVHFLTENREKAYNVYEVTVEVMDAGWSESNVDEPDVDDLVGCVLDLATVSSILDTIVDDGRVHRRIVDVGQGERIDYRAP